MKSKLLMALLAFLLASCGSREDLKDDFTLPEIPSAPVNNIKVIWPKSSQSFDAYTDHYNILYMKWEGIDPGELAHIELLRDSVLCLDFGTVSGINESYWRIDDTLQTSPNYNIKVYEENNPDVFSFSETFSIKGTDKGQGDIPIE